MQLCAHDVLLLELILQGSSNLCLWGCHEVLLIVGSTCIRFKAVVVDNLWF